MVEPQKTEWLEAICPICGQKYRYMHAYRPNTCNNFGCVYRYLHPELKEHLPKVYTEGGDIKKRQSRWKNK